MIEKFEELEGRSRGETSAADLPKVQKLRKELCDAQVNLVQLVMLSTCISYPASEF